MSDTELTRDPLVAAQDQFILVWGRMSSSWGINRTMAQIHALLLVTGRPHSVDEIIERLHISRGNASMNLRDLMEWGIVHRFRRPGDRKDIYVSEADIWAVFARVLRERKRREIDPAIGAIRDTVARLPVHDEREEMAFCRKRLTDLLEIFGLVDALAEQVFQSDESFIEAANLFRSPHEDS